MIKSIRKLLAAAFALGVSTVAFPQEITKAYVRNGSLMPSTRTSVTIPVEWSSASTINVTEVTVNDMPDGNTSAVYIKGSDNNNGTGSYTATNPEGTDFDNRWLIPGTLKFYAKALTDTYTSFRFNPAPYGTPQIVTLTPGVWTLLEFKVTDCFSTAADIWEEDGFGQVFRAQLNAWADSKSMSFPTEDFLAIGTIWYEGIEINEDAAAPLYIYSNVNPDFIHPTQMDYADGLYTATIKDLTQFSISTKTGFEGQPSDEQKEYWMSGAWAVSGSLEADRALPLEDTYRLMSVPYKGTYTITVDMENKTLMIHTDDPDPASNPYPEYLYYICKNDAGDNYTNWDYVYSAKQSSPGVYTGKLNVTFDKMRISTVSDPAAFDTAPGYDTGGVKVGNGRTVALSEGTGIIEMTYEGAWSFTINLNEMTLSASTNTPDPNRDNYLYLKGAFNNWSNDSKWMLESDDDNLYVIKDVSIPAFTRFNIANYSDNVVYGGGEISEISSDPLTLSADGGNVTMLTSFTGNVSFRKSDNALILEGSGEVPVEIYLAGNNSDGEYDRATPMAMTPVDGETFVYQIAVDRSLKSFVMSSVKGSGWNEGALTAGDLANGRAASVSNGSGAIELPYESDDWTITVDFNSWTVTALSQKNIAEADGDERYYVWNGGIKFDADDVLMPVVRNDNNVWVYEKDAEDVPGERSLMVVLTSMGAINVAFNDLSKNPVAGGIDGKNLNFYVKNANQDATAEQTLFKVLLTSVDGTETIERAAIEVVIPADSKWHLITIDEKEFASVASSWKYDAGNGCMFSIMSAVMERGSLELGPIWYAAEAVEPKPEILYYTGDFNNWKIESVPVTDGVAEIGKLTLPNDGLELRFSTTGTVGSSDWTEFDKGSLQAASVIADKETVSLTAGTGRSRVETSGVWSFKVDLENGTVVGTRDADSGVTGMSEESKVVEYYTIDGCPVAEPKGNGVFIKKTGTEVEKILR